jgi:hypothetical protein
MRQALVGIAIVASVVGQERPDFSGTWTYDAAHSSKTSPGLRVGPDGTRTEIEINSPPPPAFGTEFTAKHDAKTLNLSLSLTQQNGVARRVNGVPVNQSATGPTVAYTVAYALDGSESNNKTPSPFVGRPETETVSTAAWNANTLVFTITNQVATAGEPAVITRSFRLDSDGRLIVETTGTLGTKPQTITTAYARKR